MEDLVRHYDLGGHVLEIDAGSLVALTELEAFVGLLRIEPRRAPDFRFTVRHGALHDAEEGDRLIYSGPVLEDGHYDLSLRGEGTLLRGRNVTLHARPAERHAEIATRPGAEARAAGTAGMLALEIAVDAFGQASMHAAGLTLPGSDDAMVLLCARSGTGKTTTALSLARAGFGLCSDDAMVIAPAADGPLAWGLPRYLKVHANTASMLPWMAPALVGVWDGADEQVVPLSALAGLIPVERVPPRRVVGLFMLSRTTSSSSAEPLSKIEALAALAADNVRSSVAGLLGHQSRRWDALGGLVRQTPVWDLRVGRDIERLPGVILGALGGRGASSGS